LFEDLLVRRALTHAIDRDYIVEKMLNGSVENKAGPMPNEPGWYDPELKPPSYDPTLALALLQKAGWHMDTRNQYLMKNGALFEFEILLSSGSETDLKIARFIKLCLNDVGIRVHLKSMPLEVLNERYYRNTEFDAVLTEFSAYTRKPEELFGLWVTMEGKQSKAGMFDSPEAARLSCSPHARG
jgi:peptide/nickel transport system substrate-binding protein